MNSTIDCTSELAQLLTFAGRTATAIRMYSAYNPNGYQWGQFGDKQVEPTRSPVDLLFLADALHHLERLGNDIQGGNPRGIIVTCDDLLTTYSNYSTENPAHGHRQAKPTFELWAHLVDLDQAKAAIAGIRRKAAVALESDTARAAGVVTPSELSGRMHESGGHHAA